jgi:hypothetical protein
VRCASAGAERRGGVLCVGPAYVVIPHANNKKKEGARLHIRVHLWWVSRWVRRLLVVTGARCPLTKPVVAAVELQATTEPHCSRGVQPGGICVYVVQHEPTPEVRGRACARPGRRHFLCQLPLWFYRQDLKPVWRSQTDFVRWRAGRASLQRRQRGAATGLRSWQTHPQGLASCLGPRAVHKERTSSTGPNAWIDIPLFSVHSNHSNSLLHIVLCLPNFF